MNAAMDTSKWYAPKRERTTFLDLVVTREVWNPPSFKIDQYYGGFWLVGVRLKLPAAGSSPNGRMPSKD